MKIILVVLLKKKKKKKNEANGPFWARNCYHFKTLDTLQEFFLV